MPLTILSALLLALKNVGTRAFSAEISRQALVLGNFFMTAVFASVALLIAGVPEIGINFWWAVALASLIDIAALSFMTYSIATSDLADTYPLIALVPVFVLGTGFLILGEQPSLLGFFGVSIIVVGAYLMRVDGTGSGLLAPFRMLLTDRSAQAMMLTAFLFAVMGPLFKTAIAASSVPMTLLGSQIGATVWLSLVLLLQRQFRTRVQEVARHAGRIGVLSLANFGQAILAFTSLQLTLVAYSGSVRRTEILFTVLLGYLFFREKNARRGLVAALVMIAGVVLISIGSAQG